MYKCLFHRSRDRRRSATSGTVVTLTVLVASCLSGSMIARAGTESYIGEITTVAFSFCPRWTAELRGQLLPINQNQALFSLLGTTYGGDGRVNFALPLGKPVPTLVQGAPLLQCITLVGFYPTRP